MRGTVINGFTVVEALGSGQGGILYLARDAGGREAVIRVARDGEDNLSIRIFTEEAQKLVPAATSLETSTTPDGRRVLMAMAAPPAFVRPPPPGSGFTEHPVTQQLRPPEPLPEPTSRSRAPFAVLLLALVVFGAGAAMITLSMRSPPAPVMAVVPPALPSPPPPVALDAAIGPLDVVAPAPARDPVAAAPLPAPKPAMAAPASGNAPAGVRECVMTSQWRRAAEHDLLQYRQLTALLGLQAFAEYEKAEDQMLEAVDATKDGTDCRPLDAKIEALTRPWRKRFDALCPADGTWKSKARARALDATNLSDSRRTDLIAEINAATAQRDCLKVHGTLASLGSQAAPGPSFVCEPTAEWKELMGNNLAALETYGRELPALEMSIEAEKVGRAIATAKTAKDCAAALQQFEALKKRALK
jgi:hypothetical protein